MTPPRTFNRLSQYARALEAHAWDGDWYLRAFYDDGSRLGSRENNECQIDSIAQSWAVLSGAADPARAAQAMESVDRRLVKPAEQMILLFTPPFDKTTARSGLHQRLSAGRARKRRAVHPCRDLDRLGVCHAWSGRSCRRVVPHVKSHPAMPIHLKKRARYRVEPYVIAADIYSAASHAGRGGWTWYTGSAAWMYRLGIEAILGLTRLGDLLQIDPCIPGNWPGFRLTYRFGRTPYLVHVENPQGVHRGVRQILLDGIPLTGQRIPLIDDGNQHEVRVLMGSVPAPDLER